MAPVKANPVITTVVPTGPDRGENPSIEGSTRKSNELVPVPRVGVVTVIGPDRAPSGTFAVIWVSETTWKEASTPLKVTELAPAKSAPVNVTVRPTRALGGETREITGRTFSRTETEPEPSLAVTTSGLPSLL